MTPAHVATLAALASVVAALQKSKSKDCKAILKNLDEGILDVAASYAALESAYIELMPASFNSLQQWIECAMVMGVDGNLLEGGAEPCIVEGRYAVRTEGGLKLGPKVA